MSIALAAGLFAVGCSPSSPGESPPPTSTAADFAGLLERLAEAWEAQDTPAAVALFTVDAVYMQPPDVQLFVGHDQLESYFGALEPGTRMVWHQSWFDERTQTGAGEFSFGREGRPTRTHGVAVLELRNGRIARWHEYLRPGPASRERFLAVEDKQWEWHIGNYP